MCHQLGLVVKDAAALNELLTLRLAASDADVDALSELDSLFCLHRMQIQKSTATSWWTTSR